MLALIAIPNPPFIRFIAIVLKEARDVNKLYENIPNIFHAAEGTEQNVMGFGLFEESSKSMEGEEMILALREKKVEPIVRKF